MPAAARLWPPCLRRGSGAVSGPRADLLRTVVSLVLAWPLIGGCALYRIGNEFVSSRTAALERQAELHAGMLRQVQPISSPVGGAALIVLPSGLEIRRNYITYGGGASPDDSNEALKFVITSIQGRFQFVADAIQARHLFDSVAVAFKDGSPAMHPMGEHDFLVFVDVDGWFIKGRGTTQPRPVAMDRRRPLSLETLSGFLDGLQREAELRGK